MAANKSQGSYFALFLSASTVCCAGLANFDGGLGKLLFVAGALGLVVCLFGLLKIKPREGKTAMKPGPGAMKLVGALVAALGWLVTLIVLHLTPSTGGRIAGALVGIAVSVYGMIYILPAAFNKNALWKH
jgi:hypothetical protein